MSKARKRHGLKYHQHYQRWYDMNNRCYNAKHVQFKNYGGRDIKVAPEWQRTAGPEAFCAWMDANLKECPEGGSLDRKDNLKGYEPGNLQWATSKEQQNNRRPDKLHKKASDLPWGVYRNGKSFRVQVWDGKRVLCFGTYATVEEASEIAQQAKLQRDANILALEPVPEKKFLDGSLSASNKEQL